MNNGCGLFFDKLVSCGVCNSDENLDFQRGVKDAQVNIIMCMLYHVDRALEKGNIFRAIYDILCHEDLISLCDGMLPPQITAHHNNITSRVRWTRVG